MLNTYMYPQPMMRRPAEEDDHNAPVWQLVVSFFCKGMIEGVILLLLFWILMQVLFVKNLEVHLQILLAVGLAVFCYCLVLGCILCCRRRRKSVSSEDKEAAFSSSCHPAERVTVTLTPSPCTRPVKQQYEELDGDVLEFPTSKSSSPPSEDDLCALPFDLSPTRSAGLMQSPGSSFPMRRLSTPVVPISPTKRPSHGRSSLPSLTKLSLVSKTCRAMGRRSTVSGESFLYSESSQLACAGANLVAPTQPGEPCLSQYGSNSLSKPVPLLNFSVLFSSACGTLVVKILGLSGAGRRRSGVFVRASLPPLCPSPQQTVSRRRSISPDLHTQSFVLPVGSVEELCTCTLRLAVHSRDFSGLREAALGVVELPCEQVDWEPDTTTTYQRQLSLIKSKLKKSVSSQEAFGPRKSSVCVAPRMLGQLFILLQYQTLAQRLKVMVRKAENLAKLTRMPGAPDHYVVINLRHDGKVICTKETKGTGGPNPVWNAPFLFDLPSGDITQLPLVLEFIVMQGHLYTKSSIMGRVLIGSDTSEAGQGHWKEMCSRGQIETVRWHAIQSHVP